MRRILIDDRIKKLAERYSKQVFKEHRISSFIHPKERLDKLYLYLCKEQKENLALYVCEIKENYEKILALQPQDFSSFHSTHFHYVSEADLVTDVTIVDADAQQYNLPKGTQKFYEIVVWAMRYDELREYDFLFHINELNIHTCIYCNAQYTVTLENVEKEKEESKKRVALYQLDHFWPKSKYPFLCISFFNLHPCCANCNLHKGPKTSLFNLYTDKVEDIEPFYFDITPSAGINGVTGYNLNDLEIHLHSNNKALEENSKDLFLIDDIYKHHRHKAQETIVRLRINDYYYRRQLQEGLRTLFPDGVESPERFYWGHEIDEDKIHNRPLNKLVQDVVKYMNVNDICFDPTEVRKTQP